MANFKDSTGKWGLYSKPSGNPYARATQDEYSDNFTHARIKILENPYAYVAIFGDHHIPTASDSDSAIAKFWVANPEVNKNNENTESGNLNEQRVLNVLSSYLPKSSRARDRKIISITVSEFIARVNALTSEQKKFVERRLLSMQPEGGRQLEAARTTADSIKNVLEQLLVEATKQR